MDFQTFARAHGVVIANLIEDGRWHRVPTLDKPHRRNGAYRYMGDHGHVQDWGSMSEAELWQADADNKIAPKDLEAIQRRAAEHAADIRRKQARAAERAVAMLAQCQRTTHPYLAHKGFPEEVGAVLEDEDDEDRKLCIPMRWGGNVVGIQTISDKPEHERKNREGELERVPAFEKRFLPGQRIDGAVFTFGTRGPLVLCEGYATGLSVRRALEALRLPAYRLMVTFTAGNMRKVAQGFQEGPGAETGVVVADNDRPNKQYAEPGGTGIAYAKMIGWPFWQSDREGEDANDFMTRRGNVFALTMGLKPLLMKPHARRA